MVDFGEILRRVTIDDILRDAGLDVSQHGRMSCPIHGGNNPTAFSFSDHGFCCFSCGASGGLIDLVMHLRHCSRQDAMRHLCQLAGVPFDEGGAARGARRQILVLPPRRDRFENNKACRSLKERLEDLQLTQYALTVCVRICCRRMRERVIPLAKYYASIQIYDHQLDHIDEEIIAVKHQLRKAKRELYSDGHSQECRCQRIRHG